MATNIERFMAIFIGVIMLGSVAGFAMMSINLQPDSEAPEIPTIVNRQLTTDETIYILRTGKVVIENFYSIDCNDCLERNVMLEAFANQFKDFVVLERVVVNQTNQSMFQMIGSGGRILKLDNQTINDSNILGFFCEVAIAQPIECLI